jgi:general secretion pathway protein G
MRFKGRLRGFTLLELLVVMVIIGLLIGIVGPQLFGKLDDSREKATRAQIDAFGKALDHYRIDTGHYPSTEQGLEALLTRPQNEAKWRGPYLKKAVPLDPWEHAYQYKVPGERGEYDLFSYGSDGQAGGSNTAADIGNWGS